MTRMTVKRTHNTTDWVIPNQRKRDRMRDATLLIVLSLSSAVVGAVAALMALCDCAGR